MTKLKAGVRYEMLKLLKHMALFIAGVAWFLVAIQLIYFVVVGSGSVVFGGTYSLVFLFLIFWTAITFEKDAGFFLQSGLSRREVFATFALTIAAEALAFALLDAALSLVVPGFWVEQSLFLHDAGSYSVALFGQVFLINLAVVSCTLAVTVFRRRTSTGWTVLLLVGLLILATVWVPSLFSLAPNHIRAYGMFLGILMFSPNVSLVLSFVLYLVVVLVTLAFTWLLLRRASADRFAAGK